MAKVYHNPINNEHTTILQSSEETGGAYSLLEVKLNAGGINPVHFHTRFTEEFEAVEGVLHLKASGKSIELKPGEKLAVPPNTTHRFSNPSSESIVFRVTLYPGQPGFENFIKAAFGLINDQKTWKNQIPKSIFHAAILMQWGDTHLSNYLFRTGETILERAYRYAVKKGIEKDLLDKYCKD